MTTVRVRRGRADDVPRIGELFDAYRQFYGRKPDAPLAAAFIRKRLSAGDAVIFVAECEDGTLCGFTQLYPMFSSLSCARTYILNDLYVVEARRGDGVGRMLLDAAKRFARSAGAVSLSLSTQKENTKAQHLYERAGYKRDDEFLTFELRL